MKILKKLLASIFTLSMVLSVPFTNGISLYANDEEEIEKTTTETMSLEENTEEKHLVENATDDIEKSQEESSNDVVENTPVTKAGVEGLPPTCTQHGEDLTKVTWEQFKKHWFAGCYGDGTPGTFRHEVHIDSDTLDFSELGLGSEFYSGDDTPTIRDYKGKCLPKVKIKIGKLKIIPKELKKNSQKGGIIPNMYSNSIDSIYDNRLQEHYSELFFVRDGDVSNIFILEDLYHSNIEPFNPEFNVERNDDGVTYVGPGNNGWSYLAHGEDGIIDVFLDYHLAYLHYCVNIGRDNLAIAQSGSSSFSINYTSGINYYSTLGQDSSAIVLGGFTAKKVSKNDANLGLAGAKFHLLAPNGENVLTAKGSTSQMPLIDVHGNLITENHSSFPVEIIVDANTTKQINSTTELKDDYEPIAYESDAKGMIKAVNLPKGNYKLVEFDAPDGYLVDTTPVSVTVDVDNTALATKLKGGEGADPIEIADNNLTLTPSRTDDAQNEFIGKTTTLKTPNDANPNISDIFIKNGGTSIDVLKGQINPDVDKDAYSIVHDTKFNLYKGYKSDATKEIVVTGTLEEVRTKLNDIIAGKEMKDVNDYYYIETVNADNRPVIYLDNGSVTKNNYTVGNDVDPYPDGEKPEKEVAQDSANGLPGDLVNVGDEIKYSIKYINHLDTEAKVVVSDVLEEGLDFVSASDNGVYDATTRTVTWTLTDVKANSEGEVSLVVKVNDKAKGEVTNTPHVNIGDGQFEADGNEVVVPVDPEKPEQPEKPETPETPSTPNETETPNRIPDGVPNTGDTTNISWYLGLMGVSGLSLLALLAYKRKQQK